MPIVVPLLHPTVIFLPILPVLVIRTFRPKHAHLPKQAHGVSSGSEFRVQGLALRRPPQTTSDPDGMLKRPIQDPNFPLGSGTVDGLDTARTQHQLDNNDKMIR